MSNICQITNKKIITVNHVSHSKRRVKSKSRPNLSFKNLDVEFTEGFTRLKISHAGVRSLDIKNGLARYLLSKSRRELTPTLNKLRNIVIYYVLNKDFSDNPTLQKVQEKLKQSRSGRKLIAANARVQKL